MIRKLAWVLFPTAVVAVAWLSLIPQDVTPSVGLWDKLQHFAAYAVLAICGGFAFERGRIDLHLGVMLVTYGGILELAQIYVPGRSGTVGDEIANVLGVIVGLAIVGLLRTRFANWGADL